MKKVRLKQCVRGSGRFAQTGRVTSVENGIAEVRDSAGRSRSWLVSALKPSKACARSERQAVKILNSLLDPKNWPTLDGYADESPAEFKEQLAKFVDHLNESRRDYWKRMKFTHSEPDFVTAEEGKRYYRIVAQNKSGSHRAADGFVDKQTGAILKSAGWKGPAKNFARGNLRDPSKWSRGWVHGIG